MATMSVWSEVAYDRYAALGLGFLTRYVWSRSRVLGRWSGRPYTTRTAHRAWLRSRAGPVLDRPTRLITEMRADLPARGVRSMAGCGARRPWNGGSVSMAARSQSPRLTGGWPAAHGRPAGRWRGGRRGYRRAAPAGRRGCAARNAGPRCSPNRDLASSGLLAVMATALRRSSPSRTVACADGRGAEHATPPARTAVTSPNAVNGKRKLTSWRQLKIDQLRVHGSSVVAAGTRPRSRSLSR